MSDDAVAFSPDGSRLVNRSGDHTARISDTVPVHQRWRDSVQFGAETWTSRPSGSSK